MWYNNRTICLNASRSSRERRKFLKGRRRAMRRTIWARPSYVAFAKNYLVRFSIPQLRQIFVCKSRDGANARGYETKDGKFIVMKGSRLSDGVAEEFRPLSYLNRRKEIEGDSKIVKNKCLIDSCEFRCSSEAAAVIRGRSSNGYEEWKTPDGKMTFGDFLCSKEIVDRKLHDEN